MKSVTVSPKNVTSFVKSLNNNEKKLRKGDI